MKKAGDLWELWAGEGEGEMVATLQDGVREKRQLSGIGGRDALWAEELEELPGREGAVEGAGRQVKEDLRSVEVNRKPRHVVAVPPVGKHGWTVTKAGMCDMVRPKKYMLTAEEFEAEHQSEAGPGGPKPRRREEGELLELMMSKCDNDEFSCHEGSCIPLDWVCDVVPDCPPQDSRFTYDEGKDPECNVQISEVHVGTPPFEQDVIIEQSSEGRAHRVPQVVNVSIVDFEITGINEVELKFSARFSLTFEWFDRRLVWHNLKKENSLNELPFRKFSHLFVPTLMFSNTHSMTRSLLDPDSVLYGRKDGASSKPQSEELVEVALYPGTENPVVYSRNYHLDFTNDFDLHFYPFDTQTLSVEVGPTQTAVRLIPGLFHYLGEIDMRRFTVKNWRIEQRQRGKLAKDFSVVVRITIKRRVAQMLLSTYLPSTCILIIAQVTRRQEEAMSFTPRQPPTSRRSTSRRASPWPSPACWSCTLSTSPCPPNCLPPPMLSSSMSGFSSVSCFLLSS